MQRPPFLVLVLACLIGAFWSSDLSAQSTNPPADAMVLQAASAPGASRVTSNRTQGAGSRAETIGPWTVTPPTTATLIAGGGPPTWGWLNVRNAPVSVAEAFTLSPLADTGYANATPGTIVEVGFTPAVVNAPGPDLVMFDARFDDGSYGISTDADGFTTEVILATTDFIDSGLVKVYYYELNPGGISSAGVHGAEIDLSALGVAAGASITRVRFRENNEDACDPIGIGALEPGLVLSLSGSCPGTIVADVSGATAGGVVGLVYSPTTGSFVIPGGLACAGTTLGLGAPARLIQTATSVAGTVTFSGTAPAASCSGFLQAVDGSSCRTSNVEAIP